MVVSESFEGPLPHPRTLAEYNDAVPDGAQRVVRMAEREQRHRHRYENSNQWISVLTRLLFFLLALAILGVAAYLIHEGQGISGLVGLVTALTVFAGVYVWGHDASGGAPTTPTVRSVDGPEQLELPAPADQLNLPPSV
jgi:uncharacterized membrane protein